MKFSVYHLDVRASAESERNFIKPTLQLTKQLLTEQHYKKVAEINFDDTNNTDDTWDLERCFEMTNHIEGFWEDNPGVTVFNGKEHRSTSQGDVIVKYFENHSEAWLCNRIGWSKVW